MLQSQHFPTNIPLDGKGPASAAVSTFSSVIVPRLCPSACVSSPHLGSDAQLEMEKMFFFFEAATEHSPVNPHNYNQLFETNVNLALH